MSIHTLRDLGVLSDGAMTPRARQSIVDENTINFAIRHCQVSLVRYKVETPWTLIFDPLYEVGRRALARPTERKGEPS